MHAPISLQSYLAEMTQKTADALLSAALNVPADKRSWSPGGSSRTAIDQVAECAIVNGGVALAIVDPASAAQYDMSQFDASKAQLAADWDTLQETFEANTARLIEAIKNLPDDTLGATIHLPWGQWTMAHLIGHPYWNMAYHEGQINYIAALIVEQ